MMVKKNFFSHVSFLFILFALVIVTGCTKTGRTADLSAADNLAISNEWCVISVPYAAFKSEPSEAAEVVEHGRRSDMYEIVGKKYVTEKKQTVIWYQFEKGWLPETSVVVYQNKLKAKTASEGMNE